MKRVICDSCRKEALPSSYGIAPDGWFTVYARGDNSPDGEADFCSPPCAIKALALRNALITGALTPTEDRHVPA